MLPFCVVHILFYIMSFYFISFHLFLIYSKTSKIARNAYCRKIPLVHENVKGKIRKEKSVTWLMRVTRYSTGERERKGHTN